MKKKFHILILSAGLVVVAMALSVNLGLIASGDPEGSSDASKVDASLAERLSANDNHIPFIMMFNRSSMPGDELLDSEGLHVEHRYHIIPGASAVGSAQDIRRLADQQWIDSIFLDGSVHVAGPARVDSDFSGESPAEMVNASSLWSQGINGTGVTVAILDSGIDPNHPDLEGSIIGEVNFIEDEETTGDLLGHGTMCAGIIAGSGEASGGKYRGIAPGAKLLNVRVIDSNGDGKDSDIIAGIEWALNNGADVISMSLGGLDLGQTDLPVTTAADNAMDAGAVVCVAAGNSG